MISDHSIEARVVANSCPELNPNSDAEIRVTRMRFRDLQLVTNALNPDRSSHTHSIRLRLQDEDRSAYLIAWLDDEPIAHGMVIWEGPLGNPKQHLTEPCPYIEDLWVKESYRSQGTGRAMVRRMESLARSRGHDLVGLSVGVENYRAIDFYSQLGFRALPMPDYELNGTVETTDGEISFWTETCQYMRKSIGPSPSNRLEY